MSSAGSSIVSPSWPALPPCRSSCAGEHARSVQVAGQAGQQRASARLYHILGSVQGALQGGVGLADQRRVVGRALLHSLRALLVSGSFPLQGRHAPFWGCAAAPAHLALLRVSIRVQLALQPPVLPVQAGAVHGKSAVLPAGTHSFSTSPARSAAGRWRPGRTVRGAGGSCLWRAAPAGPGSLGT